MTNGREGDAKLTDVQRGELRASLAGRIDVLRGEIAAALRQSEHPEALQLANHFEETDDAAVADLELAMDIATIERELAELRGLLAAQDRLAAQDFGLCIDCGASIPWARLQVQPAAARCVDCQSAFERQHAGTRTSSL
jgi:DnaK suppressor protein